MSRQARSLLGSALLLLGLASRPSQASWPDAGQPVSREPGNETLVSLQSDDQGGCYVLATVPSATSAVLFRFDANGDAPPGWSPSGLAIPAFAAPGTMIADASGGAFIVWLQAGEVRATRVDAAGRIVDGWAPDGNAIVSAPPVTYSGRDLYSAVEDGAGGLFVFFRDSPCMYWDQHAGYCIYYGIEHRIQRVLGTGTVAPAWPAGGVGLYSEQYYVHGHRAVTRSAGSAMSIGPDDYGAVNLVGIGDSGQGLFHRWLQVTPYFQAFQSASDLNGGAYLAWKGFIEPGVEVLRIGSDGLPSAGWPQSGAMITGTNLDTGLSLQAVADGSAFVLWNDTSAQPKQPRALRFGPDGSTSPEWPPQGLPLATEAPWLLTGASCGDGSAGLIDALHGPDGLYVQHVLADAQFDGAWGSNGIAPLAVVPGAKQDLAMIRDGQGGLFAAWVDGRDAAITGLDVYLQHLDAGGRLHRPPQPPDVSAAAASPVQLWPPLGDFVPVNITGVIDPEGGPVSIVVTGILQDEPVVSGTGRDDEGEGDEGEIVEERLVETGEGGPRQWSHDDDDDGEYDSRARRRGTCPDGRIDGGVGFVRRERDTGRFADGRVYELSFVATDVDGMSSAGSVTVCAPRRGRRISCIDSGARFDSRGACPLDRRASPGASDVPRAPSSERLQASLRVAREASGFAVEYTLPASADVRLEVFDVAGRRTASLRQGVVNAGTHRIGWSGSGVSGVYFVRMSFGARELTRRVLVTP